jgi:release factor glutamine methyltransferase
MNETDPAPATWLATRGDIARELAAAGIVTAEAESRFIVEEVSGYAPADWPGIADASPSERARGRLELVVSNPPYVADHEVESLPDEVSAYEPRGALVPGPTGDEALEHLLVHAREWLVDAGVLVCELAPRQADAMIARALELGYADAFVRADLAGRPRVLVARAG